jgi:hypothetical protein
LQTSSPSDLICIDRNYLDRINERRRLITEDHRRVIKAIPEGHSAIQEVYSYLMRDYLPKRYPGIFSLSASGKTFRNHVTDKTYPTLPCEDAVESLKIIGEVIEDDVFLLVETEKGHKAVACCCCFPAGFDPVSKVGLILKDIHEPVPSYSKIGPSMERYFSKLEVGKSVKRMNVGCPVPLQSQALLIHPPPVERDQDARLVWASWKPRP